MKLLPRPMTPEQAAAFKCWCANSNSDRINGSCIGQQCMAWRWVDQGPDEESDAGSATAKTHGVCGHVGV